MLRVIIYLIILVSLTACIDGSEGTFIRVQNDGPVAVDKVQLAGQEFTDILSGGSSAYLAVVEAFTSPNYTLIIGDQEVSVNFLLPGDPLGNGFFTYHIDFTLNAQGDIMNLDLEVVEN